MSVSSLTSSSYSHLSSMTSSTASLQPPQRMQMIGGGLPINSQYSFHSARPVAISTAPPVQVSPRRSVLRKSSSLIERERAAALQAHLLRCKTVQPTSLKRTYTTTEIVPDGPTSEFVPFVPALKKQRVTLTREIVTSVEKIIPAAEEAAADEDEGLRSDVAENGNSSADEDVNDPIFAPRHHHLSPTKPILKRRLSCDSDMEVDTLLSQTSSFSRPHKGRKLKFASNEGRNKEDGNRRKKRVLSTQKIKLLRQLVHNAVLREFKSKEAAEQALEKGKEMALEAIQDDPPTTSELQHSSSIYTMPTPPSSPILNHANLAEELPCPNAVDIPESSTTSLKNAPSLVKSWGIYIATGGWL